MVGGVIGFVVGINESKANKNEEKTSCALVLDRTMKYVSLVRLHFEGSCFRQSPSETYHVLLTSL